MMGQATALALAVAFAFLLLADCREIRSFPIIDIDPIIRPDRHSPSDVEAVFEKLHDASRDWGFFNIINHGISQELQDRLFFEMEQFFASPREVKDPVRRSATNSRGYADLEYTKQRIDKKEVFDIGPFHMDVDKLSEQGKKDYALDGVNYWPTEGVLPNLRPTVEEYYESVRALSMTLMRALSHSLSCIPMGFFEDKFDQHSSLMRLNHYPIDMSGSTQAEPGVGLSYEQLGVGHHTDAGGITVLWQDSVGGLQVYSGTKQANGDGEWVAVPATPGSLTINVGDMLQIWSNNVFKAAEHRVVASTNVSRYSVPFFFNPNYDAVVTPQRCQEDEVHVAKPRFKPVRWGDFRSERYLGDFADRGEEIQIDEFLDKATDKKEEL